MKLAVVGTGYVGLVTGTCFAETGNHVICVDNNLEKVRNLQAGMIPIFEPGLELLIERNTKAGRLEFCSDLAYAVDHADIIFLALPTPPGEDGSADLQYILKVAEDLSHLIKKYTIVINKSTVPVGTAEKVKAILSQNLTSELFDVVSNPEFLREGVAVEDFLKPDRVVIGTDSSRAAEAMKNLYDPFLRQGNPLYFMDLRSAELTKYAANAYLATRISFMNEIANLCEKTGANVDMVRMGMGSDSRIGKRFLFPGIGYGGSCFPKDVKALYHTSASNQYPFRILNAVMEVNHLQKNRFAERIIEALGNQVQNKKIAVWGLAFKPNTDDIREAPAIEIIQHLLKAGLKIEAYDPEAIENTKAVLGDAISYGQNMYEVLDQADALLVSTEWSEFRNPDFELMISKMRLPLIADGRNVFEPEKMRTLGFKYFSVGRN